MWSYTSAPPICLHGVDRDIFAFTESVYIDFRLARCNINRRVVFCCSNDGVVVSKECRVWMCGDPISFLGNPPKSLHRIFMNPEQLTTLDCLCIYRHLDRQTRQKGKGLPQQVEVAQGVPGRLRPRIFLTFGTTRVVGRQPYAPAAFTLGEIPGTHFYRLSRPQGTWFRR
jgi:hypothetical protein